MPLRNMSYVAGIEHLDHRINALLDLATGPEIADAFMPGALLMAERWRENVPVATGNYRDNIHIQKGDSDELGIDSIIVYTDAVNAIGHPYPVDLEYGTSKMAAQPSAQRAFDESEDEAIEMAIQRLDAMILARLT